MNLKRLINKAVKASPLPSLSWLYGDYYSPYYSLMYLLAKTFETGLFVELGVERGRGLASLAAANKSNLVIGLDATFNMELSLVVNQFSNIMFLHTSSCSTDARYTPILAKNSVLSPLPHSNTR